MSEWRDDYRKHAAPAIKDGTWTVRKLLFAFIPLIVLIGAFSYGCSWFGEAASVAREEFGPRAALKKYEWFVDQAKAIDAKVQDLANYKRITDGIRADHDKEREAGRSIPRDERQALRLREETQFGLIAVYNEMVAEYNAASRKFNWKPFEQRADRPSLEYGRLTD